MLLIPNACLVPVGYEKYVSDAERRLIHHALR